ncbi:MAG: aspartate kinase [Pseudobdellovibrionaceae bacterium]
MALIVQKYGGATVADPEKIKAVAKRVTTQVKSGDQLVVVVSAMGKTTNQLIDLAHQVSAHPSRSEKDMLLTTGERISMALLSMALQAEGVNAISFTGSQAGILTDDSHVNASVIEVKGHRVQEALQAGKVVVLAGFQGVSPKTKEITTLGRGGSDTTAVAMAGFLKADHCEILKDVNSIFNADPKVFSEAKAITSLTYDQLVEMTFWGAKVLSYKSAVMARDQAIPLYVGPASQKTNEGTWVGRESKSPQQKFLAFNQHRCVLGIKTSLSLPELFQWFHDNEIADPLVLQRTENLLWVTGPEEVTEALRTTITQVQSHVIQIQEVAQSISFTYQQPLTAKEKTELDQLTKSFKKLATIETDLSRTYLISTQDNFSDLVRSLLK